MNLSVSGLTKEYRGQEAIRQITFAVRDVPVVALIGPSGGGKSTLLKILAGLVKPDQGDVEFNGKKLLFEEAWMHGYRQTIGVVFQAYNLFPHLSALRNIALPLEVVHHMGKEAARAKAELLLQKFSLGEHAHKKPYELSGGQQQRIAIARAMAMDPECLMLDEPTSALDPSLTLEVLDMVSELKDRGTHIILVTHEISFARGTADYILFLSQGDLIEHGAADTLFHSPKTAQLEQFLGRYDGKTASRHT